MKRKKTSSLSSDVEDEQHPADVLILDKAAAREAVTSFSPRNKRQRSSVSPQLPDLQPLQATTDLPSVADETSDRPGTTAAAPTGVTVIDDGAGDVATAGNRMQRLLRAPRYFDEDFEMAGLRCFRCGGSGHTSKDCTQAERPKPCPQCAQFGHQKHNCPNALCFNCKRPGHMARDCPNRGEELQEAAVCLRCGHSDCASAGEPDYVRAEGGCQREYSKHDLQRVRCCVCGRRGHLCCGEAAGAPATRASCYNCGQGGHYGEECPRQLSGHALNERLYDSGLPTRRSNPLSASHSNASRGRMPDPHAYDYEANSTRAVHYAQRHSWPQGNHMQYGVPAVPRRAMDWGYDQHTRFNADSIYQDLDAIEAQYTNHNAYGGGGVSNGRKHWGQRHDRYSGHDDRWNGHRY